MPKQITFRAYWQVFKDITVDLPESIDPNNNDEIKDFVHSKWGEMPLPKDAEYLNDSDEIDEEHGFIISDKEE